MIKSVNTGIQKLIERFVRFSSSDYTMPVRHHHFYKIAEGDWINTLILMPVSEITEYMGMKQVTGKRQQIQSENPFDLCASIFWVIPEQANLWPDECHEPLPERTAHFSACFLLTYAGKVAEKIYWLGGGSVGEPLVAGALGSTEFQIKSSVWIAQILQKGMSRKPNWKVRESPAEIRN